MKNNNNLEIKLLNQAEIINHVGKKTFNLISKNHHPDSHLENLSDSSHVFRLIRKKTESAVRVLTRLQVTSAVQVKHSMF